MTMNTFLPGIRLARRGFLGGDDAAVGIDAGLRGVGASSFGENNRGIWGFLAGFGLGAVTAGAGFGVASGSVGLSFSGESAGCAVFCIGGLWISDFIGSDGAFNDDLSMSGPAV